MSAVPDEPLHPLAIDMCELVDDLPEQHRMILAHIACCEPCRRGLLNIIQSADGYPDLFARESKYWRKG
jgi:hypothetical protein